MSKISKEYGSGLFSLANEEHVEKAMLDDMKYLKQLFSPEYIRILSDPSISKEQRVGIVSEALDGRVDRYLVNFIKLMTERNLAGEILRSFDEYEHQYYQYFDIVKVRCESAVELTEAEREKLHFKLEAHIGKIVEIEYFVVPKLVGGMRLLYDGHRIDETVRKKLLDIGSRLSRTIV